MIDNANPTRADLERALSDINERWADPALKECRGHIFNLTYIDDQPVLAVERVDSIIMGMNPGENLAMTDAINRRGEARWKNECSAFASAVGKGWVSSEMFFWSSNNLRVLTERVGDLSPHLKFCAKLNKLMIRFHRPKVVFQPGLQWSSKAEEYYDLTRVAKVRSTRKGAVLVDHFTMPDGTPWLCTPHWTAARGLSRDDKAEIRSYATSLVAARS